MDYEPIPEDQEACLIAQQEAGRGDNPDIDPPDVEEVDDADC